MISRETLTFTLSYKFQQYIDIKLLDNHHIDLQSKYRNT